MMRILAVAIVALALAGCDQFNKGFNASFDKSTHDGCMRTASASAGAEVAERYCTCVVAQLDKYSAQEKMRLNQEPDKLRAAAAACAPNAAS